MSSIKQELNALRNLASQYEYHWEDRWDRAAEKVQERIIRKYEAAQAQIKAHEEVIAELEEYVRELEQKQKAPAKSPSECMRDAVHEDMGI